MNMKPLSIAFVICYGVLVALALADDPPPCPAQAPLGSQAVDVITNRTTGDPTTTADPSANKTNAIGDYLQGAGAFKEGDATVHEEFWKPVTDPCEDPGTCHWSMKYYWKSLATLCVSTAEVPGPFDCAKTATGQGFVYVVNGTSVSSAASVVCQGSAGDDKSGQYSIGPTINVTVHVGSHVDCTVASWSRFRVQTAGKGTAHHTYDDPILTVLKNELTSGTCGSGE